MKIIFKKIIRLLSMLMVMPFAIVVNATKSAFMFGVFGQLFSLIPDGLGHCLRAAYYHFTLTDCPMDVVICFGTYFTKSDVVIGKGVYIGGSCNIGMAIINDNATIASNVCILSGKNQHGYMELDVPIQQQRGVYSKVVIGENSWIGHGAIIMANIGKQNVVASGAVVTKETGDYDVMVGNPAVVVKNLVICQQSKSYEVQ